MPFQRLRLAIVTSAVAAFAFVAPAAADLSEDEISRFVESLDIVQTWSEENDVLPERDSSPEAMQDLVDRPVSGGIDEIRDRPEFGEVEAIISDHGFDNADEWGAVGDRVMRAFMVLEMERENPNVREDIQAMTEQAFEDEEMTEAQREMVQERMEQVMGPMTSVLDEVPQSDLDAVRPYQDSLRQDTPAPQLD